MATGEVDSNVQDRELATGEVRTATGRLSVARRVEPEHPRLPFSAGQLTRIDEALSLSSRSTGLEFAIYLGDLGEEAREYAADLHANLGSRAHEGVLLAVSPQQRQVEIVTGEESKRRVPDRSCQLALMSMVASFREGELVEGLISGLRMLSDAAGSKRSAH